MLNLDPETEFGARVARRLRDEQIGWPTTVGPDGTPQPSPIWFLWDGESFLIYGRPSAPRLRNVERSPRVALNLDGDGLGGDIVVVTGEAWMAPDAPPADAHPAYLTKYRDGIAGIGMTPEGFARAYSVALRMTPTHLRGH